MSLSKEQYITLRSELEHLDRCVAAGQDTPEIDLRIKEIEGLMVASPWTTDMDTGDAVLRILNTITETLGPKHYDPNAQNDYVFVNYHSDPERQRHTITCNHDTLSFLLELMDLSDVDVSYHGKILYCAGDGWCGGFRPSAKG